MKWLRLSVQILILAWFIFYSQFYKIGNLPFRTWDETRLATNAYEMVKSGNLIVTTIAGVPDMWNTKPPLMIWAQAACIKLNGFTEFSVRFPAAFCALLTIVMITLFVWQVTKSSWAALLAGIVLSTSMGYFARHGTRLGEYDSMLAFFSIAYVLSIFVYCEMHGRKGNGWLMLFFISLTGAVLTKGIAGLLLTPAVFLYVLYRRRIISTLTSKYFYLGLGLFFVFVCGYYLLREHYKPGYLLAVSDNELGGRFNLAQGGNVQPWSFYWDHIRTVQFGVWYWGLLSSFFVVWFVQKPVAKRAMAFCLFAAMELLVMISISKTKMPWYDLPAFPLFAVTIAILIWELANIIGSFTLWKPANVLVILMLIFCAQPTWELCNFVESERDDLANNDYYSLSYFFRDAIRGKRDISNSTYIVRGYALQWNLYANKLNDLGAHLHSEFYSGGNKFTRGQKVISNDNDAKGYIEKNYEFRLIEKYYGVNYYLIIGPKGLNHADGNS